jgi:hypothetical protein
MELRDKTKRPVKKLLCKLPSKLLAKKSRPNRLFAEKYSTNTETLELMYARGLKIVFESTCITVIFLGDDDFTTA